MSSCRFEALRLAEAARSFVAQRNHGVQPRRPGGRIRAKDQAHQARKSVRLHDDPRANLLPAGRCSPTLVLVLVRKKSSARMPQSTMLGFVYCETAGRRVA